MQDECYMQRCFDLAKRGAGSVSPNPMVGAVLVYEGKIIGEGWHRKWGEAHAEVNCFESVSAENKAFIPYATLYCSLEPCSHVGKTPPCADLILRQKVPKVVVCNTDPNPLVAGKGLAKLRAAGVEVVEGLLEKEGRWLNRAFFTWITRKRPFVILKWAQSADGYLGETGKTTAISGPWTKRLVHRWRSETDAILVGAATATQDDPQLNVRHYFGKDPLRILLDGKGSVALDRKLLSDEAPAFIFSPNRGDLAIHKRVFPTDTSISLEAVLKILHHENRATLLVEGGANVLRQFIDQDIWDEIRVIENPMRLGAGIKVPEIPAGAVLREKLVIKTDTISFFSRPAPPIS